MTEDREARLTAFALNDPALSAADRQEVEALLAADPAARRAVDETKQLARLLTAGLAAEQAAAPAVPAITIPNPAPARRPAAWARYVVAAAVLVAVAGGALLVRERWKEGGQPSGQPREVALAPDGTSNTIYGDVEGLDNSARTSQDGRTPAPGGEQKGRGPWSGVDYDERAASKAGAGTGLPTTVKETEKGDSPALPTGGLKPTKGVPPGPAAIPSPVVPADKAPGGPDVVASPVPKPVAPPAVRAPVGRSVTVTARSVAPGKPIPGTEAAPLPSSQPGDSLKKASKDALDDLVQHPDGEADAEAPGQADRHPALIENSFVKVEGINALSTFGVDVDTASYAIVRKYLSMGQLPPANAVRLEEMVNYFPYADKAPDGDNPFAVTAEMAECPWQPAHRLVRLGLKARPIAADKRPPSNLVFLIDVSGSMDAPNRLPLVKAALKLLVSQLGEKDRVAMVVYAGASGLVLDSTPATEKEKVLNALDALSAGGSTNGSGGIQQAYEVATANFIKGGTNRVVLCTDGDWNVGTTSTDALVKLIEQKRETGVYLSVFGFGMGNLRDEMLVQLANKGNGNYGYIDTMKEAHKAFVEQLSGTLVTVAKDVKIQVEFNPAVVRAYRLLGYEKRALAAKDFHDDTKDAGEMGAGHVVTALYELVPVGAPDPTVGKVDGLRYQPDPAPKAPAKAEKPDEAFVVKMRHKKPDADTSTLREMPVKDLTVGYEKASEDFQFAAAVASFAMLLRDSPYKGHANYGLVLELADAAKKHDPSGYRTEFVELVKKAKSLAGK